MLVYALLAAGWLALVAAVYASDRKRPRPHEDGDGAGDKQADDGLPVAA